MVYDHADEFDVIHNHCDYLAFPFARRSETPTVTTMHGRLDLAEVRRLNARFPEQHLVSISDANWLATVYNGIDVASYHFRPAPGDVAAGALIGLVVAVMLVLWLDNAMVLLRRLVDRLITLLRLPLPA